MDSHKGLSNKKIVNNKSFILGLFGILFLALPLFVFLLQQQQQIQQRAAETITLKAINDTYVSTTFPDTPVGSNEFLRVRGGGMQHLTYLKFDLTTLAGMTVTDAKLHLYSSEGSVSTFNIKNVSNNWQESQITFNDRPWPGTLITTFNNVTTNTWKTIDLTSTINTRKGEIFSLVIDSTDTDELSMKSSESPDGNSPMLVVTTTSTGTTATIPPTGTNPTITPIQGPCPPDSGTSGWLECHYGEPQYNLQACRTHAEQWKGVSGPVNGSDTQWFNWALSNPKPLSCGTACGVAPSYCLPAGPSPTPTLKPKPTVSLSATPLTIVAGQNTTLTWTSSGADTCTASGEFTGWTGSKNLNGTQSTGPFNTAGVYTLTLTCTNSSGSTSDSVDITVQTPSPTPTLKPKPTVSLSASPLTIVAGQNTTLTWTSAGADTCTASGEFTGWTGSKNLNGTQSTGPFNTAGVYTLTLTCTNSSGSTSDSVDITVQSQSPTPGVKPTVNLTASETSITTGNSVVLTWTSTNADTCSASGNFANWSGNKTTAGNQSVGVFNAAGTFTLTLTCTNEFGTGNDSVTITVLTPTLTATPIPSDIVFNLDVYLHGVGNSGDNRNPSSELSNKNPLHPARLAVVELYDNSNQLISSKEATVNYTQATGNFLGTVNMGNNITNGNYTVKIKTEQHLRNQYSGIFELTPGMTVDMAPISLVTGDVDNNNRLDILDYNVLYGCYTSDLMPTPRNCSLDNTVNSDINDDGGVNLFDLNLFIRELSVQSGL